MSDLAQLRAGVAKTIASLPEVIRSCSADVLVGDIASVFDEDDYRRCARARVVHARPLTAPRWWPSLKKDETEPPPRAIDVRRSTSPADVPMT